MQTRDVVEGLRNFREYKKLVSIFLKKLKLNFYSSKKFKIVLISLISGTLNM